MTAALDFIRRRVAIELQLLRYLKRHPNMASPEFDALVQEVANLSASSQVAVKTISDHAAASVDTAQIVSLTAQVRSIRDALDQAVANHPAPVQG